MKIQCRGFRIKFRPVKWDIPINAILFKRISTVIQWELLNLAKDTIDYSKHSQNICMILISSRTKDPRRNAQNLIGKITPTSAC